MFRKSLLAMTAMAFMAAQAHAAVIFIPIYIPMVVAVPEATKADYRKIHTVAVISALGDNFNIERPALGGPDTRDQPVTDWKLDDQASSLLKQYLGGRFTFRDIAYDRAALAAMPNGQWVNSTPKLTAFLKNLPADGVDAFLVVRPDLEYQAPGVEGIGLQLEGSQDGPVLWENYEVDIVDAHTQRQIAKSFSRVRLRDNTQASFTGLIVAKSLAPDDKLQFTDKQLGGLKLVSSYLLRVSMIETVRALDLGVALPAAGARVVKPIPADSNPYKKYSSIAVVSALGDTLTEDSFGFMGIGHDRYVLPVPQWQLDAQAEDRVRKALAPRFTVKTPEIDRNAISQINLMGSDKKLRGDMPVLPRDGADLYLVLDKIDLPVNNGTDGAGAGIYKISAMRGHAATYLHYIVMLVDGHSLKIVGIMLPRTSPDRAESVAWKLEDENIWPVKPPDLDATQAARIRDDLVDMLDNTIDETLLRTGLTGLMIDAASLPPAEAQVTSASATTTEKQ